MKKVLKWIGIILLVLLILLITAPFLFKDKIVSKIKEETNKNINAKVDFGDFDLSLIRNFPNFSLGIENLSVINVVPFTGDTLIYAKKLDITIDLMSVISGGEIKIRTVSIDSPVMNFLVNKSGQYNWDIAKASTEPQAASKPSTFKASLKKYTVNNGRIVYDDKTLDFYLKLTGVNHEGKGDFTQDLFVLSTLTDAESVDLAYGGVKYIAGAKSKITADVDMDMKNFKFTFKENKIHLNELDLAVNGWVAMPDTNIDMDLTFAAAQSDFKNFISMIPAVYKAGVKDLKSSGKMALNGFIKGRYNAVSMTGFGLNLNIDNGMFQYPSLPAAVNDVFVDLKISNPDGIPDHTVVNLSRMHLQMAGAPIDARLILKTPVSDMDIDAFVKGKVNLSDIQKVVPLEKGTTLSGMITSDLTVKGRMSAAQQKNFNAFTASGNFAVDNLHYTSPEMKQPVDMSTLQLSFNPQTVALNAFKMNIGKSDFSATGSLENFIAYALKGETIKGKLNLNSTKIDLNEFMGNESSASGSAQKDTAAMSVLEIPGNVDFVMSASVGTLAYEANNFYNLKGELIIRDKAIRMKDIFMQLLDGSMNMNGAYSSADPKKPTIDFDLNVHELDIQKTSAAFSTVRTMAPIIKNCYGKFSTTMTLKGDLDQHMMPIMNSLSGAGKLSTSKITVQDFPAFNKAADLLKMPSWKKLEIQSMNPSFKFVNGRVYIDPFDVNINNFKSTVAGSNGFDQTIDYTMAVQIPRASFGGAANSVMNNLVSQANAKGANVSIGETIPVNIKIGGTVNDPTVSTDLNTQGAKAMEDLKAKAKEEFEKKKMEAEAKAKEEADKYKAQAQKELDAQKAKAAAESERLKKEAEAKAKAAADSAKKDVKKKAEDAIKNINPFKK